MFDLPVKQYSLNPLSYNKEEIISCIENNFNKDPIRNAKPCMGSLHQSLYDTNDGYETPNYELIKPIYAKAIDRYLTDLNLIGCKFNFYIANYTCISEHTNMRSHFHTEADFSAVHYIQYDKKIHSSTRFNNPFVWNDYKKFVRPKLHTFLPNQIENSWFYDWWECEVEEDDIVFFPALLKHEITTQKKSDKYRISIALNIELIE